MNGWRMTSVGEFCPFIYGKGLPKTKRSSGKYGVYSSAGLIGSHSEPYTETAGIVIGRKGTVGSVHLSKEPFWPIDTAFFVLDEPQKRDLLFTFYRLSTLGLSDMNSDSAVPGLNRENAHAIEFLAPPLAEQREIASILGALDDKIELNRRMATTLEEMARALYRSWFVDFDPVKAQAEGLDPAFMDEATAALFPGRFGDDGLPEGWGMASIYEVSKVQYGAPFKSNLFNSEGKGRPLVRIRDLKNHQAGVYTTEVHPKEYLIQPGDTVVGMDGDFTPYTWCAEPSLMNQRVCCFIPINRRDHAFVRLSIPALLKAEEEAAVATTVIHLGKKDIDTFKVVIPPASVLNAFGERVNPILSKLVAAGIETKNLAALRDTLLPKLMSGELRVGEARDQIEEVA